MYQSASVTVITVDLANGTCQSTYVIVYVKVTFKLGGIPQGKYVKDVLATAIGDNRLGDLPVSGTTYQVHFQGK